MKHQDSEYTKGVKEGISIVRWLVYYGIVTEKDIIKGVNKERRKRKKC